MKSIKWAEKNSHAYQKIIKNEEAKGIKGTEKISHAKA